MKHVSRACCVPEILGTKRSHFLDTGNKLTMFLRSCRDVSTNESVEGNAYYRNTGKCSSSFNLARFTEVLKTVQHLGMGTLSLPHKVIIYIYRHLILTQSSLNPSDFFLIDPLCHSSPYYLESHLQGALYILKSPFCLLNHLLALSGFIGVDILILYCITSASVCIL